MRFRVWDKKANCYVNEESHIPIQYFWIDYLGSLYYQEPARDGKGYLLRLAKNFIFEYSSGLRDVNGKEIYEGDIVLIGNPSVLDGLKVMSHIIFMDGSFCLKGGAALVEYIFFEIIGNIHQNPTLLEN